MSQPLSKNETGGNVSPVLSPTIPLTTRASNFVTLWGLKLFSSTGMSLLPFLRPISLTYLPTLNKAYPCRPHLENRIFIPKDFQPVELLPLFIDVHGGGFAMCSPIIDDEVCRLLSDRFRFVVVSVNYSKSPRFAFPVATHDVAAISQAVIDDESLPIDKSRIAMGGFSAGGNLALSASQLPELQGKIKAAVSFYAITDFTISAAEKNGSRPYRGPKDKDMLTWMAGTLNHAYIPLGQDLRDPLLSVSFARREVLPEWIFSIGAEYDILANEAREMMYRLAEVKEPTEEEKYAFEKGTYRWKLVRDVEHGFTHGIVYTGEKEERRIVGRDQIFGEVGEWLMKGPFSK